MSLDFKYYKIDDIGEVVSGGTPSTSKNEYWYGDIGWITPKDLSSYEDIYISRGERNISSEGLNNSSAKLVPKNTVLMTSRAPIGYIAIAKNELSTNQGFKSLICDEKICHYKYFYYWLKLNIKYIINNSNGSTFKEISGGTFKNLEISLPSINEQKAISSVLWTIDEKISVLKRINKNLTKLIDTNFKNYLLNFENYSEDDLVSSEFGPIPKEWEVNNLTGIANYQNGLAMQKFPPETPEDSFKVLKIKELRQGFFDESSDLCSKNIKEECIVYDGDVIFSWSGSLLVDIWTGGTCGLNQHLFKVTSSNFDKWFYYCWTKFYLDQFILIAKDKATTMGHIKRQHLEESLVLIPDEETYYNLTILFKPLFEYLTKNKIEIKKLQSLRDTLLPKLMSGKIDVSKINCDL
ncbi:restriction endonuclease subunit S [uncultured Methanobrevibacter sp.]|uniref:restriction endonuclease subunit S n=1 Tax=uncultured Methanobrevibacter sp. TaxID=253161 RepID=UPI002623A58F|nr:restriction endonuclease subunit S [uncultured Methanobrevibacter sp.]